jgi:hypothetical protein
MKNFDASDDSAASVLCIVCENRITGGRWFARINSGGRLVALCCPLCQETFMRNPFPYVRRMETYDGRGGEPAAG